MKLDGESGFCQGTLVQKPSSTPVEVNSKVNDNMGALEPDEKLIKESCNEVVSTEGVERDGLWINVSEFDCSTSDDSTNANEEEEEARDFEEPALYQKDVDQFYNAKSVIECELPEIIVCYKESVHHDNVVKDICVDEGVTSLGQLLFGHSVEEDKIVMDTTISMEKDCCKESTQQIASTDPMQIDLANNGSLDVNVEKLVPESTEAMEHSIQISDEEAMSEKHTSVSADEEGSNNVSNNKSTDHNANVETDSARSADLDLSKHHEDAMIPDDCHMVSSIARGSQGESSFSVAGPLSGLITYSGPIAYSGSCSLRSDSSTTSTRSFAFPVLQAEWNSSPVRMRAAERRKHKGWRQGLLCCRF